MHSRIIELSDSKIPAKERMTFSSLPEWFFGSVADYADDSRDRKGDIEWFVEALNGAANVNSLGKLIFLEDAKTKYFGERYEGFLENLKSLECVTRDEFTGISGDIGNKMYRLNEMFNDKFSMYVYYKGDLTPLDEWIRETNLRKGFFFGGTVDYHF